MEIVINPAFGLGEKGYGIKQKQTLRVVDCPQCDGQKEIYKNGHAYYCSMCKGSGVVHEASQKWYVDEGPFEIGVIRATISKNQIIYKYKGRIDGSPSNKGDSTLFRTIDEAVAECNKRNKIKP
jgi:hypothetical protein